MLTPARVSHVQCAGELGEANQLENDRREWTRKPFFLPRGPRGSTAPHSLTSSLFGTAGPVVGEHIDQMHMDIASSVQARVCSSTRVQQYACSSTIWNSTPTLPVGLSGRTTRLARGVGCSHPLPTQALPSPPQLAASLKTPPSATGVAAQDGGNELQVGPLHLAPHLLRLRPAKHKSAGGALRRRSRAGFLQGQAY